MSDRRVLPPSALRLFECSVEQARNLAESLDSHDLLAGWRMAERLQHRLLELVEPRFLGLLQQQQPSHVTANISLPSLHTAPHTQTSVCAADPVAMEVALISKNEVNSQSAEIYIKREEGEEDVGSIQDQVSTFRDTLLIY